MIQRRGDQFATASLRQHAHAFLEQPVGDEFPVERRWVDSEDFRGPLLLTAGVVEHLEDVLPLQFLEGEVGVIDDQAAAALAALDDARGDPPA